MKLAVVALVLLTSATAHAEWDRLLGVDADGKHAIVVHDEDPWHADTYDVASGKVVATWKATGDDAKLRASGGPDVTFLPVDGTLAHDLIAWAALVARTGNASTRGFPLNGMASKAGVVYQDHDRIMLGTPDGRQVELAHGGEPRVSPDGTRLFWLTYEPLTLHVAAAQPGARARAVGVVGQLEDVQWSVDGGSILAYAIGPDCVVRYAADTLASSPVACDAYGFAQDPTGKTLAVHEGSDHVRWLDAKSGKLRGETVVPVGRSYRAEDEVVSADGLFAELSDDQRSILVADLAHDKAARIDAPEGYFFEGVRATRWVGGAIVVVQTDLRNVTIRRIDVRAALH